MPPRSPRRQQADSAKAPAPVADAAAAARPDSHAAIPAVDQAAWADSVQKAKETEMYRETFAYSGSIRDPFNSLLNMAKSGPGGGRPPAGRDLPEHAGPLG